MDLAFVIPRLTEVGGAEKYLYNIVKHLSKNNDCIIYTLKYDKKRYPDVNIKEINLTGFLNKNPGGISTILDVFSVLKMQKRIPKHHEIYNTHIFPANLLNLPSHVWTAQEPPRMLYDLENETLNNLNFTKKQIARIYFPLLRYYDLKKTTKNVSQIIANSTYSADYIKKIYNKPIKVIYPGIDENLLKIKKYTADEDIILSVGRLYKAKRINLIIEAFSKVKNAKLIIIGDGPERNNLEILSKGLNIEFTGNIGEKELYKYYSKAKLTIYTPLREMFGMVPMESIASGTPVVAVNEGGFTEIIKDCAILTNSDSTEISKAINELLTNKSKYKQMSIKGREIAKEYTWKKTAEETEKLFKQLLIEKA